MFCVLKTIFVGIITFFEVVGGANVYHLFVVCLESGLVYDWLLTLALGGAEVFAAAVAWFVGYYFMLLFREELLVVCLNYGPHILCTTVRQFDGIFVEDGVQSRARWEVLLYES